MASEMARNLTPEELVEKKICPVKKEFLRGSDYRKAFIPAVGGSGTNGEVSPMEKKGRKQQKRERDAKKVAGSGLCFNFVRNTCTRGDTCKFNHDLATFMEGREPDLPGLCPFSNMPGPCPFGILCRWASAHSNPDALTQKYLIDNKPEQPDAPAVGVPPLDL